jgi:hypothetical protein
VRSASAANAAPLVLTLGAIAMTRRAGLVCVVLGVLLTGCGGRSYKTAPVSGKVTLDGKALPHASVMFIPEFELGSKDPLPSSVGLTDDNGNYTLVLNSSSKAEGAVLGKHKIIIAIGAEAAAADIKPTFHKQVPARYTRVNTTPFEKEVVSGDNAFDFQLTSKP